MARGLLKTLARIRERGIMRYLLRKDESLDTLLEKLSGAAYSVVSEILPEGRREDVEMGMYVALTHVLATRLVCGPDCGILPACSVMRETNPLEGPAAATAAPSQ
jgi:hypothetical protein